MKVKLKCNYDFDPLTSILTLDLDLLGNVWETQKCLKSIFLKSF